MDQAQDYQQLKSKLSDRWWRLNNLYYIKDKKGNKIKFQLNWAQKDFYDNLWYFNIILKARQLGFTTFVMIYFLDACLFNSNHSAGVIAHTREDAEDLFTNKIKFAFDNLPEWLRNQLSAKSDTSRKMVFSNGSSITVGTSLRSGTYQKLLVSEYGKVSAKYPEKAKEIKTGAFNTVDTGQQIIVESTAEGQAGEFFDMCEHARKLADMNRELTAAEPLFHFYPWYKNPEYVLSERDTELTIIEYKTEEYLRNLGVELSDAQKAWYQSKLSVMGHEMKREFPSTPAEAFEGSTEGAYYAEIMGQLRRSDKIRPLPLDPSHGVMTFWDLGLNDQMSIWFAQYIHGKLRFIDYHESSNEGWRYYGDLLTEKGYNYLHHYFPHDGMTRRRGDEIMTDKQMAEQQGIRPISIVPRTTSVSKDIRNYCKPALLLCEFDISACAVGLNHLDNYKKKWDKATSMFRDEPLHDEASHGSDAFRTAAVALKTGKLNLGSGPVSVSNASTGLRSRNR